jgi:enamine deaminase RidA (YjgF/YER057c/UK114 family)
MPKQIVSSGTKWEAVVGYSRAVRIDAAIFVAGTTATGSDGQVVGVGDPYLQTQQTLRNIESALAKLGASISDVVRTRIFVVNIDHWETIGRAHCEIFAGIRPAATMVEVARLIDPAMLVEIEVDAIVQT